MASEKVLDDMNKSVAAQSQPPLELSPAVDLPEKIPPSSSSGASQEKLDQGNKDDDADEKPNKDGLKPYFRIFAYADRLDFTLYGIAGVAAIAVGASLPLMTLITGSAITAFSDQSSDSNSAAFQDRIDTLVLYFVYIFVARFVLSYVATLSVSIAAARTTRSMRKAFLEHTLRQEVWHFDNLSSGSVASQVTTNGNRINTGIAEKLYSLIMGVSLFFASYIVALAVQWKLALITMSIVPANIAVFAVCIAYVHPIESRIIKIYSRAGVLAQEAFSTIKTVHAFGAQQKTVDAYDEYLQEAHVEGNRLSPIFGTFFATSGFLVLSATALAFWEGHRLFSSGEIASVGTVFEVVLSVTLGATSIMIILPTFQAMTDASSAAAELFEVMDKPSSLDPMSPEGLQPETCHGEVIIRDLTFAYPARADAQVLQGLNLTLPAGKTTALVGASGCGKSTVIGLLERWYLPTGGSIALDGIEIDQYNLRWLRSNIRLVQQEPVLFQGTVYDNVAKGFVGAQLGLPEEEKRRLVEEACTSSNAHDFIQKLPDGYDTEVGERASMLSGGQRQRVAIARSIISDPKILLLDEATSALDPRAERVVQDALNRVSQNKTTLIIAHKLATVMAADNIAVMTNGRVVEQGTHQELVAQDGLYAAMVRAQDLGRADDDDTETPEESVSEKLPEEAYTEDASDDPEKALSVSRTVSQQEGQVTAATGTLGYSLRRCLFTMLSEHSDLYWLFAILAVGCTIGGGTYPAQAIVFSRLISVFSETGPDANRQADFWALMFFVIAIANLFGKFALGWCCNRIGQTTTHRYRREMFDRMLYFDQDFFDHGANTSGALTSKLSTMPTSIMELMSANLGLMLEIIVNIFSSSIVGIAFGWKLGLVLVFGGLTVILTAGVIRVKLDRMLEASTGDRFAASAGLATEAVTSIRTISSLTIEPLILRQYGDAVEGIAQEVMQNLSWTLIPHALSQSVDFLVMALGFWYGSTLVARGEYTETQFYVVFIAIVFGGQGAVNFFGFSSSFSKGKAAANYVLWLRTIQPQIRATDANRDQGPTDDGPVALEHVEFQYAQRHAQKVLRDVSLDIPVGSYAAFVGPSGCGKSTLVSLLMRFYDPTSGRVLLDGRDIADMSPILYRRHMSLVQQEPPLYSSSVRANIALGLDYDPSDADIHEACRQANALDFVSSLPQGLETPCGMKGLQFSGGQRQRIAVARALIRQPRLLLLDEATSALDTHSERIVQKALDEAASGRTTIAVAHRLSTIRHAHVIFVVEDGKIAEMGSHESLQRLRGRYYAMCLAQALDQTG